MGKYIDLNFKLKEPGSEKAVAELREMVASHETPNYKGSSARGQVAKSTPPRKFGNMEFSMLEALLPFYENSLKEILQTQSFTSNFGEIQNALINFKQTKQTHKQIHNQIYKQKNSSSSHRNIQILITITK